MVFRKIASSIRIDGPVNGGTLAQVSLGGRGGGRMAKVAMYQIKILQASSNQARVGLILNHGPDGQVYRYHSTPIAHTPLTGTDALLLSGQADVAVVLGEYLEPLLTCIANDANVCWAVVDVYEMRKPF